jgi:hypothetical protein
MKILMFHRNVIIPEAMVTVLIIGKRGKDSLGRRFGVSV